MTTRGLTGFAWLVALLAFAPAGLAQSLWERRDPDTAYLFKDTRARQPGDLLTIAVNEVTEVIGDEKRSLDKETTTSATLDLSGKSTAGSNLVRAFTGNLSGQSTSQRKFDGLANTTIDRKLVDRMTVVVVAVLPNGNLVVEGRRMRVIARESRVLVVSGVVRPIDIGANNTIQSHFIGEFKISYDGKGPESSYMNHNWLGRIMNKVWPF